MASVLDKLPKLTKEEAEEFAQIISAKFNQEMEEADFCCTCDSIYGAQSACYRGVMRVFGHMGPEDE